MAWSTRPCFRGDLFLCADVLPVWYSGPRTKQLMNLQRGASALGGRNAVCRRSLPCVRRVDGGTTGGALWPEGPFDRPLKPGLQKRLKGRIDWGGNHLGCLNRANQGLQYGLSGNRVAFSATERRRLSWETTPTATGSSRRGNPTRPKP